MGTADCFDREWSSQGVKLVTHLYSVLRLRICGATLPRQMPCWRELEKKFFYFLISDILWYVTCSFPCHPTLHSGGHWTFLFGSTFAISHTLRNIGFQFFQFVHLFSLVGLSVFFFGWQKKVILTDQSDLFLHCTACHRAGCHAWKVICYRVTQHLFKRYSCNSLRPYIKEIGLCLNASNNSGLYLWEEGEGHVSRKPS